jgi:hypothetical protein
MSGAQGEEAPQRRVDGLVQYVLGVAHARARKARRVRGGPCAFRRMQVTREMSIWVVMLMVVCNMLAMKGSNIVITLFSI